MHAIARGMSEAHDVYLVDGGRPVPRRPGPRAIDLIPLPRLARGAGLGTDAPVASLLEQRIRLPTQAVERIRPDAILVDIYPFSKWEVEAEITRPGSRRTARAAHGDPTFARIEDYFDRAADVPLPVHYTGFVAGTPTPLMGTPEQGSDAVLSCGGNTASLAFLLKLVAGAGPSSHR